MKKILFTFTTIFLLLVASCVSTITLEGKARPAISSKLVRVMDSTPENAEYVGYVTVSYGSNWTGEAALNEGIGPAKSKAASVGANCIVIENREEIFEKAHGFNALSGGSSLKLKAKAYYIKSN